jgi:hypothetical protein
MNVVAGSLYRIYRPVVIWTWSVVTLLVVVANVVITRLTEVELSLWQLVAGQAAKYWLLVLGVLLIATHLKLYVANGITRREFLAGAGLFAILAVVVFAALVPIGRGVEWLLWNAFGVAPTGYPDFTAGEALRDFGHYAPGAIGFVVTGALVAAGFYRYTWWAGLLLIIPFAMPLVVSEALLGLYTLGASPAPRVFPFAAGLVLSLLASAAGVVVLRLLTRDVPIRPSAG